LETLKVGFVGSGFIADFHLKAMGQVRSMELQGLLPRSGSEQLAATARRQGLGQAVIYPTVAAMAETVDAIAIYCPNDVKVAVMEEIAAAKKRGARVMGVICDKPLGRNVAEAQRIVDLADDAGLRTAYFENQIFMKSVRAALRQIAPQQQAMGPLMLTRSAEEHGGPHKPWFWDPKVQGGGVLSDMGCHSIAVGWYALTPFDRPLRFLQPVDVQCSVGLLKWGQPAWRAALWQKHRVDYGRTPAEDFATGVITFRNPETGQLVKAQFTDSWMYEKQGLRLLMDGMGPGYAFEVNTLQSPVSVFIGDDAAATVADRETALEKSLASRGLLSLQANESDLYGYVDENADAAANFLEGRDGALPFSYGLEIMKLVMAAYLSAETKRHVSLVDETIQRELARYVPAIQQGHGADVLY